MAQCVAEAPEFLDDVGHAKVLTTDYADDTHKTNCEAEEGRLRQRCAPVSGGSGWFKVLNVGSDFRLKIPDFVERAFGEYGEISGILGQEIRTVRLEDSLHPPHLFDGLIKL